MLWVQVPPFAPILVRDIVMANMINVVDDTTKCLSFTKDEAVRVIEGLIRQLGEVGSQGLPEVVTPHGYRIAFVIKREESR